MQATSSMPTLPSVTLTLTALNVRPVRKATIWQMLRHAACALLLKTASTAMSVLPLSASSVIPGFTWEPQTSPANPVAVLVPNAQVLLFVEWQLLDSSSLLFGPELFKPAIVTVPPALHWPLAWVVLPGSIWLARIASRMKKFYLYCS